MRFYLGDVKEKTVDQLVKSILKNPDEVIVVHINSDGGCYRSALNIYELLRTCNKQVITHVTNTCYSAAVIVYLAGELRYVTKQSHFMIHEVSCEPDEDEKAFTLQFYERMAAELRADSNAMFRLFVERTNLSLKEIRKNIESAPGKDWYFEAKKAIEMGVAHKVGFPIYVSSEESSKEDEVHG